MVWIVRKKKTKLNVHVRQQLVPTEVFVVIASDTIENEKKFQDAFSPRPLKELGTGQLIIL